MILGGAVAGYLAKAKFDDAKSLCGEDLRCDTEEDRAAGQDLVDAARFRGNVSTVLAGAGFVAVGAGVVFWFMGRDQRHSRAERVTVRMVPLASPNVLGLAVRGAL